MMHEPEKSDSAIVATKSAKQSWATGGGADGAKGGDREEREPAKHVPGTEPGKTCHRRWVTCGKLQRYAASRQILSVGVGCLNWARPDLRGGRPVMAVPTAKTKTGVLKSNGFSGALMRCISRS